VAAIEYAHLKAVSTGCQTRVTIDSEGDSVRVERFTVSDAVLAGEAELPESTVEDGTFSIDENPTHRGAGYIIEIGQDRRTRGVDIVSASFGTDRFVTFDGLNGPSNGGSITLAYAGQHIVVSVADRTGQVTTGE
jgi:hypothetical protein